jgi:hypothetical protein
MIYELICICVMLMVNWILNNIYLYIFKEEQGGYVKK